RGMPPGGKTGGSSGFRRQRRRRAYRAARAVPCAEAELSTWGLLWWVCADTAGQGLRRHELPTLPSRRARHLLLVRILPAPVHRRPAGDMMDTFGGLRIVETDDAPCPGGPMILSARKPRRQGARFWRH